MFFMGSERLPLVERVKASRGQPFHLALSDSEERQGNELGDGRTENRSEWRNEGNCQITGTLWKFLCHPFPCQQPLTDRAGDDIH